MIHADISGLCAGRCGARDGNLLLLPGVQVEQDHGFVQTHDPAGALINPTTELEYHILH